MSARRVIFISHARPADDEITRWLCGRLTARGYRVWADIEHLLGGERFWAEIQRLIRNETVKFITIISRISVSRNGVLDELAEAVDVGRTLGDNRFIIPVRADDIPWSEFPIQLKQLNGLDFSEGWMRNFGALLRALETGGVPQSTGDLEVSRNAELLVRARQTIQRTESEALFNRLNVIELPDQIRYFHTSMSSAALSVAAPSLSLPCVSHDRLLVSFAELAAMRAAVPAGLMLEIEDRFELPIKRFLAGNSRNGPSVSQAQAHNHLSAILRGAFERHLRTAGLVQFDQRWFVPVLWRPHGKGRYWRPDGREAYRMLVGKSKELTWHFAISFKIFTSNPCRIQLVPHVLFSTDGVTPLPDQKQLRRQRCKLWWNDKWRDLLLAFCSELFGHRAQTGTVSLGGREKFTVTPSLMPVTLPVSYSAESAYLPESEDETTDWGDDTELGDSRGSSI